MLSSDTISLTTDGMAIYYGLLYLVKMFQTSFRSWESIKTTIVIFSDR